MVLLMTLLAISSSTYLYQEWTSRQAGQALGLEKLDRQALQALKVEWVCHQACQAPLREWTGRQACLIQGQTDSLACYPKEV